MSEDSASEWILPVEQEVTTEKQILKEFIFNLESLPELWDSSSKSYSDKIKRMSGYQKLLTVYKKIKPTATVDDVRKKINSLRSNYRKELKRIVNSKRSGASADDVYTPKSWTFHAMQFLDKTEKPVNASVFTEYESDSIEMNSRNQSLEELDDSSFSSINSVHPPKKKTKVDALAKQNELIEKACSLLTEKPQSPTRKISATAIYWSEKLESLQTEQKLFAEKGINEILFEAALGNLNKNSIQINQYSTSTVTSPDPNDAPHTSRYELPVSSESNIFTSIPSPEYIFVSQSKEQSPAVIYKNNIGPTRNVYSGNKKDISIQSLFSSFNGQ